MPGSSIASAVILAAFSLGLGPAASGSEHDFEAAGLDAEAVESGLRARLGDELDGWAIAIDDPQGRVYAVQLRAPDQLEGERRTIEVSGANDEDRSRELASTLALIIDAHEPATDDRAKPAPNLPRGFVVAEGHFELGPPRDPDPALGVGLGGGAWVLHGYLQPRVRLRWTHGWGGDLRVHGLNIGAGVAAGVPLGPGDRLWVGAALIPSFKWIRAEDTKVRTALAGGGEASALIQYRRPHLILGLRTGIETTFRPVRIRGSDDVIRWGPVRWLLVLELGLGI